MSKPATEARLAAAANGFTQVIHRGDACIVTKNPTTGRCCVDAQVGRGWHYGAGLETDTAWEADSDNNYLKMTKASYNLRARKLFNAGDLIQYIDPASGENVKFQPQNFQWIDGTTGSNSLISVAKSIATPTIDNDKLRWTAAFGTGRHFEYIACPTKLIKHLILDSAAMISTCPAYITNPFLELTFTLTPSAGVTMYVDGVAWDASATKTTANAIEFRLSSGQAVWKLAAPVAYDSSDAGNQCNGQIKLYVNKKIKYCSVQFPKAWFDTATYPVYIDPTIDYQVGTSADDGAWWQKGSDYFFSNTAITPCFGSGLGLSYFNTHVFSRWTGVTIPVGATIDVSYVSIYRNSTVSPQACTLYFEDAANPSACSSWSNANGRTKTTANISITAPTSGTWFNSNSINTIIQELVNSYDYSAGAAMQMLLIGLNQTSDHYCQTRGYDYTGNTYGYKLHIEYTEPSGGILTSGILLRGGSLLHGILGR